MYMYVLYRYKNNICLYYASLYISGSFSESFQLRIWTNRRWICHSLCQHYTCNHSVTAFLLLRVWVRRTVILVLGYSLTKNFDSEGLIHSQGPLPKLETSIPETLLLEDFVRCTSAVYLGHFFWQLENMVLFIPLWKLCKQNHRLQITQPPT